MKNRWKTLGWELAKEHPAWYDLFEKLEDLGGIVLDGVHGRGIKQGDTTPYQLALLANYFKSTNSYLSVALLCDKGLVGDAKTICRKLIELLINMVYMSEDREKRQYQYWSHMSQKPLKDSRAVLENEEFFSEDVVTAMREIEARASDALKKAKEYWDTDETGKVIGDFKRNWSGKLLPEMAKACGMKYEYIVPYVQYCTPTHASSWDIPNYFQWEPPAFGQHFEHDDIPMVMSEAMRNYWGLTILLIEAFNLDLKGSAAQFIQALEHQEEREFGNEQR